MLHGDSLSASELIDHSHNNAVEVGTVSSIHSESHSHSGTVHANADKPPSLEINVEATDEGLMVKFELENFELNEAAVDGEHVDGQGHIHLYVNGEKVSRVFDDSFALTNLSDDSYAISADLNSNDHRTYMLDGAKIQATLEVFSSEFVGPISSGAARIAYENVDNDSSSSAPISTANTSIPGIESGDSSATSVHTGGDFNGDGIDDLIISAPRADVGGALDVGEIYVVFGSSAGLPETLDLSTLNGQTGVKFIGLFADDMTGISVGGGGDLNGDGLSDIVIGASGFDPDGRTGAGAAYVVYGSSSFGATFNLASINGTNGFRIEGANLDDAAGHSVAIARDVNDDGLDDVLVGAPFHDSGGEDAGAGYIIFGKSTGVAATIGLSNISPADGVRIDGTAGGNLGYSIQDAGDLNGDSIGDVAFGAPTGFGAGVSTSCDPANTVGLIQCEPGAAPGYTLFAPNTSTQTYLVDQNGFLVNSWSAGNRPGLSAKLLDDGSLLRSANSGGANFSAGGRGGRVEIYDWDGNLTWQYNYNNAQVRQHHDVEMLPNGNVLMIAWELKTSAEAIAAGRDPSNIPDGELWPDHIIEVQPTGPTTGNIVWEWHVWDHLIQDFDATKDNFGVVADNPQLIDINFTRNGGEDWTHTNSIDYNPALDQILLSVHGFSEIWVIDHSTTTAEAATHSGGNSGKGGDLLYRWGNPQAYDRGTAADQKFYTQHDAQWILPGLPGEDNILVFNNGQQRPGGNASSVEEIAPPVDATGNYALPSNDAYGPSDTVWTWLDTPPSNTYAQNISGAHRLANGNTLITNGPIGRFLEVDSAGNEVFEYVNPVINTGPVAQGTAIAQNAVFRATKYDPSFAGFAGKDLTPGNTVETGGSTSSMSSVAEGAAYVLFGSIGLTNQSVSTFTGSDGFKVSGIDIGDQLGLSVSAAGDVNDDGFSDVVIGSPRAKVDGRSVGAAYVVLGQAAAFSSDIDAGTLNGTNGYRLANDYQTDPLLNSLMVNTTGQTGHNGAVVNFDSVIPDSDFVHIHTSGIPHYTLGPWGPNPNDATDQNVTFYIPRNPEINAGTKTRTRLGAIGTWIDGTAIFNWSDGRSYNDEGNWNRLAVVFEAVSFDSCGAHPPGTGQYHTHGAPTCLINELGDNGTSHSPLLGWSFDGFPIYGPYGYVNGDPNAGIERMESSWNLRNLSTRADGPTLAEQALGSFREDFQYVDGSGDLDRYNGRFSATPEYPDGIYHYHVTIDTLGEPAFPYVLGVQYNGVVASGNANIPGDTPVLDAPSFSVGAVGDINGDRRDDVVIGDPDAYVDGIGVAGTTTVVFGHDGTQAADTHLHSIDSATGLHLDGDANGDQLGASVGPAGDINGDGAADLIVGAPGSDAGEANAGESYVIEGDLRIDLGDTPAPYPTLVADDGARHLGIGPRLGGGRDTEADGNPGALANGDGADEDGVSFGILSTEATTAEITIDLQNAAQARVDAWIDFDGNGVWESSDQILDAFLVVSGMQTIVFNLPANTSARETFARVRVSADGNLPPTGWSGDGEVEDYLVSIYTPPTVENIVTNDGNAQRSYVSELEVHFDQEVVVSTASFEIKDRASGVVVDSFHVTSTLDQGKTVTALTFLPGTSVVTRDGVNSLMDGNYELKVIASEVEIAGGPMMSTDYQFGTQQADRFFRFFGDKNGDRDVDIEDLGQFGQTFRKSVGDISYNDEFDYANDGDVDIEDLGEFGTRFRNTLSF